jgi:hypothetical protein
MRTIVSICQRWFVPTLAAIAAQAAMGQGIIYVQAPLSNPDGNPNQLPWDSLGTQVGPDFSIIINGQSVLTFTTGANSTTPAQGFMVQPSSTSAVIAFQPNLNENPSDPTAFVVPLSSGTQIDATAAAYGWLGTVLGGDVLTAARSGGIIGEPPLTDGYFTGLEFAYMGFDFQQNGETYYGWVEVGCPVSGFNAGWVYSYAYETTPNTSIFAGEGAPTPEPSTWALFAAGAVFVMGRKKLFC